MIVVNCCNAVGPQIPQIIDWVRFFTATYGFMDDFLIVCVYAYSDFPQHGIESKTEARQLINFEADELTFQQISWYKRKY